MHGKRIIASILLNTVEDRCIFTCNRTWTNMNKRLCVDLKCWKRVRTCDPYWETGTVKGFIVRNTKGIWLVDAIHLVMKTPLTGCVTPLCRGMFLISPLLFFYCNCSADEAETGSESWPPGCPRKNIHGAANPGISLHKRINTHVRVVFTTEYDVALRYSISYDSRGSLWLISTFLSQHFLGEAVVRLPEVYRHSYWTQGDLELILRICLLDPSFPAFVERVEAELRKLLEEWENNSWRQKSQVSCQALFFFSFFLLKHFSWAVPGGGARAFLFAPRVLWNVVGKCSAVWQRISKTLFSFKVFIQKRKISVSLKCLIVAIYSGPSAPTLTQGHRHRSTQGYVCIETGVMQLQQWNLLCQFPSDPTLLKLHSLKQTVLHISI